MSVIPRLYGIGGGGENFFAKSGLLPAGILFNSNRNLLLERNASF
jgi:hypothetical protein